VDQPTFTKLTGRTLTTAQATLLAGSAETAKRELEDLLGWPLDPDCWDDQYLERGKTQSEGVCVDDATELDAPDDVVGSTRIFNWNPDDYYLQTDPLVTIHSVKLVSDDVTYKTFELGEYRPQWVNGRERYAKYIEIKHDCPWYLQHYSCCCLAGRQIAVDADWAFEVVPRVLKQVWADLVWQDLNPKRDLRSQTLGPHSYTFATNETPLTKHAPVLRQYAGPHGTAAAGVTIV
jgi:hypothetical protein